MTALKNRNKFINVEKIRQILEARGIPHAEFGRRIGIEQRELISRRLNNSYVITGDELILMARELGVPVGDLETTPA